MRDPRDADLWPLVQRLNLEQKVSLLTGQDSWSLRAFPEIGLRSIVMSDGPAGVRGPVWDERDPSHNFPSPTLVAASWDVETARSVGEGMAVEARRKGVDVLLAPTINLQRTPYGGRHFEAFSEDPILTAHIATAFVEGVQQLGVAATVKHYVANDSETDRFTVNVRVDERALRELYLLAFEQPVVTGRAWLVMSSYNSINGVTSSENPLLTSPLSDEWAFDGVVVSDWTGVRSVEAARHPQDLAMPGPKGAWGARLLDAVEAGRVEEQAIDAKVLRILRLASRVNALKGFGNGRPELPVGANLPATIRTAASDGMVLLTNNGVLPLDEPASIAVIGEAARYARTQGGGSATVIPPHVISPLEGIHRRWPDARVEWEWGTVVQPDVVELPHGTYETPGGEPGLLVRYLDADGEAIDEEIRSSSALVWFNADSVGVKAATVEFSCRYTHSELGDEVLLGIAGLADYSVDADGASIATGSLRTGSGDDPASVVLNPPSTMVRIPLRGPFVDLVVRFRAVPGGMPDARALTVGLAPPKADSSALISEAVELARRSDVAVVVVGTSAAVESEGFDRTSLLLPGEQDRLVREVAAASRRTVVVVNSGAPVLLPWRDEVDAVIAAWFPGEEFGNALADVLSGDVEPGGRLPMTWPALEEDVPIGSVTPIDGNLDYVEGIDIGYRAWLRHGVEPAYPFGHGLGYTSWGLSEVRAASGPVSEGKRVSVAVCNEGDREGKCVVQFYVERVSLSSVERPIRWLAGFESVRVGAGDVTRVETTIPWRSFAHWEDQAWRVEPGTYAIRVGVSSKDAELNSMIEISPAEAQLAVLPEDEASRHGN